MKEESGLAATARAFATYSLVPYLGILFCPGAVVLGSVGLFTLSGLSIADRDSRRVCATSFVVGVVLLAIQFGLWWILYRVPAWAVGLD
jgi:hypothetical protein